ncbi:MAG TPA: SRPBCC domain-containing protein [Saprospiraceae bacterium]|nr:SRPBCC domain-containing protein [Saprospiraceae bacterium]
MKNFTLRVPIKSESKRIFEFIATPQGIENWFLRQAKFILPDKTIRNKKSFIQSGDKYEWKWHGYPDYLQKGKVLKNNGKNKLSFTFTGDCIVTLEIKSEKGETILLLTQTNIPPDKNPETNLYIQCQKGWTFYMTNLKSVLENGYDLRNRNDKLKKVVTA